MPLIHVFSIAIFCYIYIYIYTLLALNKVYKSCLGVSEGTLPLHPWQIVLMHLKIITLPSFTLPTCSHTIPDSTSFQGKGERIHAQISCITFRSGVVCEEFLSCCRTKCPTGWWLQFRYKQIPTLKSGNNFKCLIGKKQWWGHTLGTHT